MDGALWLSTDTAFQYFTSTLQVVLFAHRSPSPLRSCSCSCSCPCSCRVRGALGSVVTVAWSNLRRLNQKKGSTTSLCDPRGPFGGGSPSQASESACMFRPGSFCSYLALVPRSMDQGRSYLLSLCNISLPPGVLLVLLPSRPLFAPTGCLHVFSRLLTVSNPNIETGTRVLDGNLGTDVQVFPGLKIEECVIRGRSKSWLNFSSTGRFYGHPVSRDAGPASSIFLTRNNPALRSLVSRTLVWKCSYITLRQYLLPRCCAQNTDPAILLHSVWPSFQTLTTFYL